VIVQLTDMSLLEAVGQTVRQAFSRDGFCFFQSRWVFVATWHNLSTRTNYYARTRVCAKCQVK